MEAAIIRQMTARGTPSSMIERLAAALLGVGIVLIAALIWRVNVQASLALMAMASILSLAMTPLLLTSQASNGTAGMLVSSLKQIAIALCVALIYFALHHLLTMLFSASGLTHADAASTWLMLFVLMMFIGLFVVQSIIRTNPNGAFASRLYPWFYNGLYLDELFTRLTFRLYPIQLKTSP